MKRWDEKILTAACGLVLALVGTVWAVSWGSANSKINDANTSIQELQRVFPSQAERIKCLEANQEENKRRLERIERKLDVVGDQVNSMDSKVEVLLRRTDR